MSDLGVFLHYVFMMRKRALKSIVKNLYIGLLIVIMITIFAFLQFWKMIHLHIDSMFYYRKVILFVLTVGTFLFTVFCKKTPLECHPASMIHLSGDKFQKILRYQLYKKVVGYGIFSFLMAFLLMKFDLRLLTVKIQIMLWNLWIVSLATRQIRYHQGRSYRRYFLLAAHYLLSNIVLYLGVYGGGILLVVMTSVSGYVLMRARNTRLDFHKLQMELIERNKANYLARANDLNDAQKLAREISAQKNRKNIILRNFRSRNPLIQKNIITFSRTGFFVPIYLAVILGIVILLYQWEIFEFVRVLKKSGFAIDVVVLHQVIVINNLIEWIASQKNLLVLKSKEGLYLSYGRKEIANSFFVIGLPMIVLEVLIIGVIFKRPVLSVMVTCLLYAAVFYLYLWFEKKKKEDLLRVAIYFAVLAISYYLIKPI